MTNGGMGGTKDRGDRIERRKQGQWSTVSSDLLFLASRFYKLSEKEVGFDRGKTSKIVFAGIPLLPTSLSSFIIECESIGRAGLDMRSRYKETAIGDLATLNITEC
jgi:hypothetical protein